MVKEGISKWLPTPEIEGMNNLQCQLEKDLAILVSEQPTVERHMRVKTGKLSENLTEDAPKEKITVELYSARRAGPGRKILLWRQGQHPISDLKNGTRREASSRRNLKGVQPRKPNELSPT